jgi:hypothetical protein
VAGLNGEQPPRGLAGAIDGLGGPALGEFPDLGKRVGPGDKPLVEEAETDGFLNPRRLNVSTDNEAGAAPLGDQCRRHADRTESHDQNRVGAGHVGPQDALVGCANAA